MIFEAINRTFQLLLSKRRKHQFERIIFVAAIVGFILHFLWIVFANFGWLPGKVNHTQELYINPIASIYTPFTIILLYEIYSLIYYLPKSITIYLGKQYEVITLILIRRIFDTLSRFASESSAANSNTVEVLLITFGGLLIVLLLIFCFYKLSGDKKVRLGESYCTNLTEKRFVVMKKLLSIGLIVIFVFLLVQSVYEFNSVPVTVYTINSTLKAVNNIFFNHFFTALILTEILLLLFTFTLSHKFNKVIRNSGFIISTTLLKLSFQTQGTTSVIIIIIAVVFGVAILAINQLFERKLPNSPGYFSSMPPNDKTNEQ